MNKIHITEDVSEDKWFVAYDRPYNLGGEGFEVDERTAFEMMEAKRFIENLGKIALRS